MALVFTNTLSGKKETFRSLQPDEVRMYTCGPTVYDFAHIGNFRAYLFEDLLRRVLKHRGYRVIQVMNITDIDDKTIRGAQEKGVGLPDFTDPYINSFFEDLDALRIERAEHYPRATQFIAEMVQMVERLLKSEHAYQRDGSVYYRIKSFKQYGKLSRKVLSENIAGARVDQDEYQKDEPCDFALWKRTDAGEPSWNASFGSGRPGWHIECSAMSMKLLGDTFDIHTGGEDNIFPHHENEIAQSEGASGKPFVRFWLHCRFLLVNGEKMSKSKGNFYTVRDLLNKGCNPRALRYVLISHHYRQPLNFTMDSLKAAERTVARLNDFNSRFRQAPARSGGSPFFQKATASAREYFHLALDDDLNITKALGRFFDWVNEAHAAMDRNELTGEAKKAGLLLLDDIRRIVDVFDEEQIEIPGRIRKFSEEREEARKAHDFKRADALRQEIARAGFAVEDTSDGPRIKKL